MENKPIKWTKRRVQGDFGTSAVLHELFEGGERRAVLEFLPGRGWDVAEVIKGVQSPESRTYKGNLAKIKRITEVRLTGWSPLLGATSDEVL